MLSRSHRRVPPSWSHERAAPRILIEAGDGYEGEIFSGVLERHGWETAVCPGPGKLHDGCPLLNEGACPAVDGADAIVYSLGISEIRNRSVLWTHRTERSRRPLVVTTTAPAATQYANVLDGLTICAEPVTAAALVQAVSDSLERIRARRAVSR